MKVWIRTSLIVLVSALIGAVAAKIDSRRKLLGPVPLPLCSDVPCPHFTARMAAIESIIAQQSGEPVYLAIGDSITEYAGLERIAAESH